MLKKIIKFMGGIFGGQQQQRQAPPPISDSARSVSYGSIIEAIGSTGKYAFSFFPTFIDLRKKIYLDELPIISEDGSVENFKLAYIAAAGQASVTTPARGYQKLTSETSVAVDINFGTPVTRAFVNQEVNALFMKFSLVLLRNIVDSSGNTIQVDGNSVQVKIELKQGTGAFVEIFNTLWASKFSSPYELEVGFNINPGNIYDTFQIRVTRLTAADTANDTRVLRWENYSQVIYNYHSFKRLAYVEYDFDTEQFGTNLPERKYLLDGMFLDLPSNATVNSVGGLVYTGTWDGTLRTPLGIEYVCGDVFAIIWYLLTDKIDGVGEYLDIAQVDKWSLQACSVYNNKILYINSDGTPEHRILYRLWINSAGDAWEKIDSILATSFVRRYWEGGILKFTQDRPSNIVATISNTDVAGDFTYSSTDIYERTNTAIVTWIDGDNFGKTRQALVDVPEYVNKFGIIEKQVEAVGCYSQLQAIRYGRHIIYSENLETRIVTFQARQVFSLLSVGSVILVVDNQLNNERLGGILLSASGTTINLDAPVEIKQSFGFDPYFYTYLYSEVATAIRNGEFTSAFQHYLLYGKAEGRHTSGYLLFIQTSAGLEIFRVTNTPGVYMSLTISGTPIGSVSVGYKWALLTPTQNHQTFRILSKEIDDENLDLISITAQQYEEKKYAIIERSFDSDTTSTSAITGQIKLLPPTGFAVYESRANGKLVVTLRWDKPLSVGTKFIVGYRQSAGWVDTIVTENNFSPNLEPGLYKFRIQSVGYNDVKSAWVYSANFTIGYVTPDDLGNALVYSLRKVNSAYTGNCVKVRRSSDNTTQDIGWANGWVDKVSLLNFCASSDGFVEIWYEGNGRTAFNLVQTTTSNQPKIVNAGQLYFINNKPIIYYHTASSSLTTTATVTRENFASSASETTIFVVSRDLTPEDNNTIAFNGGSERIVLHNRYGNNDIIFDSGNETTRRVTVTSPSLDAHQHTFRAGINFAEIRRNYRTLFQSTLVPNTLSNFSATLAIAHKNSYMGEILIFPQNKSNYLSIEQAQFKAWFENF